MAQNNIPFGWLPVDPATIAALAGNLPLPFSVAAANGAMYYLNPAQYAPAAPPLARQRQEAAAAAAARQRQEEEEDADKIRMVHLLVTSAGAIQAGDYSVAHDNLNKARSILVTISNFTGIGRVAKHFVDALEQRLFPMHPQAAQPPPPFPVKADMHNHFYDAGPYLKFAHSTANQAILDAFRGCDCVHIVDFSIMQGLQWPALIHALSQRDGGPPYLRITGVGGAGDELAEVSNRLKQFAGSLNVPFTFRELCVDQLDGLRDWMLGVVPGEALAFNSVLQLHRLLVDPDADPAFPAPIDTLLHLVTSLQPRVFTVVEQEADHNRPALLDRFANALFYYASMFDSLEAASHRAGGCVATRALAEACLRDEILDVVCGEGSARLERHEPMSRWRERLARAGLAQVPFGPDEARQATEQLAMFSASGYGILECDGGLALAWHDRPLYAATAWRATGWDATAGAVAAGTAVRRRNSRSGESNGRGNWAYA